MWVSSQRRRESPESSWSVSISALVTSNLTIWGRQTRITWPAWKVQASFSRSYTWSRSRLRLRCLKTGCASWPLRSNGCKNRSRLLRSIQSLQTRWSREETRTTPWWIGINRIWSNRKSSNVWLISRDERPIVMASVITKIKCSRTIPVPGKTWKICRLSLPISASRTSMRTRQCVPIEQIMA